MQIFRPEIKTGLLVVITLAITAGMLLYLGAPGVLRPVQKYSIYFENAGGVAMGAPVLLAGRKIGQVSGIFSPVLPKDRPPDAPDMEALVEVSVDEGAPIYRQMQVAMKQNGLLEQQVIDFTGGGPEGGIAPPGTHFVGQRTTDFAGQIAETLEVVRESVRPLAEEAQLTMKQLRLTAANLEKLSDEGSDMVLAFERLRLITEDVRRLTGPDGPLESTLSSLDAIASDLVENERIELTLRTVQRSAASFQSTARELQGASRRVNATLGEMSPDLIEATRYTRDLTDTLRRQPWRLLWPTTKKYPDEQREKPLAESHRKSGDGKSVGR